MVKTSSSSENKPCCSKACKKNTETLTFEARLAEHRNRELKYYEKIRVLEFKAESRADCIESLTKELELIKKEKDGLDRKLAGFQTASKDLDNLLESQRSDKNKEGLGYSDVPPPPAQIYYPPKKYMSWTGLLEFADDTITDYSRPVPTANDSPTKSKIDKVETAKKPPIKYAKLYRKPSKGYKVRGNQRNWNNLKSQQLAIHKPYRPPMRPTRPNTNTATRSNVNNARPQTTQDLMVILIQRVKRLKRELKSRTLHIKIHKVDRGRSRSVMAWVPKNV
nr:hypothetical protein [Tanacetum cinerariifolium]